jgi:hypothetical protein
VQRLLRFSLLFLLLLAAAAPLLYFLAAKGVPPFRSEREIAKPLKDAVEAERKQVRASRFDASAPPDFERPELAQFPPELVSLYLGGLGCADYLATPRGGGVSWARRFLGFYLGGSAGPSGPERCEWLFSAQLARELGIQKRLSQAIATHRIHRALSKDKLLAYSLATLGFDEGVLGVGDASLTLFKKDLRKLSVAELSELSLVLPPHGYYEELRDCANPAVVRKARDSQLDQLVELAAVSADEAERAKQAPAACARN